MALYFGYKKNATDTEDLEKSISALKTGIATNNGKTKALETKMSTAETDITSIKSTNATQNSDIQANWVKGITNGNDITWVKNKANSNATGITQLAARVILVEARKKFILILLPMEILKQVLCLLNLNTFYQIIGCIVKG